MANQAGAAVRVILSGSAPAWSSVFTISTSPLRLAASMARPVGGSAIEHGGVAVRVAGIHVGVGKSRANFLNPSRPCARRVMALSRRISHRPLVAATTGERPRTLPRFVQLVVQSNNRIHATVTTRTIAIKATTMMRRRPIAPLFGPDPPLTQSP